MFGAGRPSAPMEDGSYRPPPSYPTGRRPGRTFAPGTASSVVPPPPQAPPPPTAATGATVAGGGPAPHRPPARLTAASSVFASRRVVPPALLAPLCLLAAPPAFLLGLSALSGLSGGYPTPTALLALGAVAYVRDCIRRYAPDEEKRSEALDKCRTRLPLLSILVVGLTFRVLVAPTLGSVPSLAGWLGLGGAMRAAQLFGGRDLARCLLSVGTRLALGTAALSLAVVGRYLGWFSVVRCSSVPLQPNPIDAAISALRTKLSSVDAILDALVGPDPTPPTPSTAHFPSQGRTYAPAPPDERTNAPHGAWGAGGGRYQRPTLPLTLAQIVLHAVAGAMFANVAVLPLLPAGSGGEEAPTLLTAVCALSSAATVAVVVLDGTSHELRYSIRADFAAATWSAGGTLLSVAVRTAETVQRAGLVPYLVLIPLLCHAAAMLHAVRPDGDVPALSQIGGTLALMVLSYASAVIVSVYLVATDALVRRTVAAPGLDVDRLLYYLPLPCPPAAAGAAPGRDGTPFLPEDLIVQSVLWGCDGGGGTGCHGIVRDVVAPRLGGAASSGAALPYGGDFDLEEEEVRRNDAAVEAVADAMVPTSRQPPFAAALLAVGDGAGTLEEDLLRVAVLESLGGGGGGVFAADSLGPDDDVMDEVQQPLGLSARHYLALRRRLLVSEEGSAASGGRQVQQPVVVPVVRALCAYAGGLGEALVRTSGIVEITTPGAAFPSRGVGGQAVHPPTTASRVMQWYLPPGATACAEYSILAAARLVALNFTLPTRGGAVKRRYSWLALLVPSLLHSAHRLRCGLLRHAQSRMERSATMPFSRGQSAGSASQRQDQQAGLDDEILGNFIASNCPDLRRVLAACDEAAIIVIDALKELDGPTDAEIKVHRVCRTWLNGLL